MGRADDRSRRARLDAAADLCGVDRTRRQPPQSTPPRSNAWNKSAWRRYLYTAAHAPSLVDLERIFGR
jgi:hypothetical protein